MNAAAAGYTDLGRLPGRRPSGLQPRQSPSTRAHRDANRGEGATPTSDLPTPAPWTDPARFSVVRLAHYCLDIAELLKTRRVVPIVIFLSGGPNERRLKLGSEQTDYLNFHFIAVALAAMPYRWKF